MVMVPCPGLSCGSVKHAKSSISFCCCAAAMLFKAVLFLFFFSSPDGGERIGNLGKGISISISPRIGRDRRSQWLSAGLSPWYNGASRLSRASRRSLIQRKARIFRRFSADPEPHDPSGCQQRRGLERTVVNDGNVRVRAHDSSTIGTDAQEVSNGHKYVHGSDLSHPIGHRSCYAEDHVAAGCSSPDRVDGQHCGSARRGRDAERIFCLSST